MIQKFASLAGLNLSFLVVLVEVVETGGMVAFGDHRGIQLAGVWIDGHGEAAGSAAEDKGGCGGGNENGFHV